MPGSLVSPRGLLTAIVAVIGLLLLWQIWPTVLIAAAALMFASALSPWADALERRGLGRGAAVLLISALFAGLVVVFVVALTPVLVQQARALVDDLPGVRAQAVTLLRERHAQQAAEQLERFSPEDLVPPQAVARAGAGAAGVLSTVASFCLLAAYMLLDARRLRGFVYYLLPERSHARARYLMHQLQQVVGGYVRGQAITSLCIMAFTFVMLVILRVPNALALSALAFLGDMVPIVGAFVIIVPTALAAWQVSTASAVIVVVLLTVYIQFENNVLVQRVYGATLNLPSTAVLLGIMVGGQLFGVAGALLSLPATASLAVLTRYWHDVRAGHDPALSGTVVSPLQSDVCPSSDDVCPEVERAHITVA